MAKHITLKRRATLAFERAFRAFGVFTLSLIAKLKFRARVSGVRPAAGESAVILCNHGCIWDFCFLLAALRPRRVRFVATSIEFEKNKMYAWMLGALGVIKKKQGAADSACVRNMLRAVNAGDVVALYAAGMTSFDGRPAWQAQAGTEKLIRLLNVPVYTALVNGSFISHPRYAHKSYRGRVELMLAPLLTKDETRALSLNDIRARVASAIYFNDWDWQQAARVAFRGSDLTRGITRVLYLCPDCGREGTLIEGKNTVECTACGMRAARDAYGWFHAQRGKCPARMDEWMDIQLRALNEQLAAGDICLNARVTLKLPTGSGAGYIEADKGELTLNKSALTFKGAQYAHEWTFSDFQYFVLNDLDFLHIYATDGAYRFVFDDPKLISKWFFAHRALVCP